MRYLQVISGDGIIIWVLIGVGAIASIGASVSFFTRDLRARRALKRLRLRTIDQITPGTRVKISGRLRLCGEPVISASSQTACAYYFVAYEKIGLSNASGVKVARWQAAGEEEDIADFEVSDGTGTVLVRTREGAWPQVLLKETSFHSHGGGATDEEREREGLLATDAQVTVVGRASVEAGAPGRGNPGLYRDAAETVVIVAEWVAEE